MDSHHLKRRLVFYLLGAKEDSSLQPDGFVEGRPFGPVAAKVLRHAVIEIEGNSNIVTIIL